MKRNKLQIMKAVRKGEYKFNREYIIDDYAVKNANTLNFDQAITDATIKYVNWQIGVVQTCRRTYGDYECQAIINQCIQQLEHLIKFLDDWKETKSE